MKLDGDHHAKLHVVVSTNLLVHLQKEVDLPNLVDVDKVHNTANNLHKSKEI